MKENQKIQSVTPRIVGDNEDVTSIITEDQQHVYVKEYHLKTQNECLNDIF